MSLIPKLKRIEVQPEEPVKDPLADLKRIVDGIHAMSEDMATADILAVDLQDRLSKGEELDMEAMKTLASHLGEIYELINDILEITDEYVPPEDDEAWLF